MHITSTRNSNIRTDLKSAVLKGLSDEGGLFVPSSFPSLDIEDLRDYALEKGKKLSELTFKELALKIWSLYSEFELSDLEDAIDKAYEDFPIPLVRAGNLNILELFHGKSGAFKDVALSLFPAIVRLSMDKDDTVLFITATSGDTGSAAMKGISSQDRMKLCVMYPAFGVSMLQEAQMLSEMADNILPIPLNGDFDCAQSNVKEILESRVFSNSSSCNSINIARLISQITYYYHAYLRYFEDRAFDEPLLNFSVPSGNFGDVLAGYYAKRMGLPVGRLIVATNENDVLREFITTGVYDRKRELIKTISPSMDILVSSNVERLLYHELGSEVTSSLMKDLKEKGTFEVKRYVTGSFDAYSSNDEEAYDLIGKTYKETGYVMDPHTACGAAAILKNENKEDTILLSTASPFKFPATVLKALNVEFKDEKDAFMKLQEITPVQEHLKGMFDKKKREKIVYEPSEVLDVIKKFAGDEK